jgi:hypothetical protein
MDNIFFLSTKPPAQETGQREQIGRNFAILEKNRHNVIKVITKFWHFLRQFVKKFQKN